MIQEIKTAFVNLETGTIHTTEQIEDLLNEILSQAQAIRILQINAFDAIMNQGGEWKTAKNYLVDSNEYWKRLNAAHRSLCIALGLE